MASSKRGSARHVIAADSTAAVDAFMASLQHPHKSLVEAIRRAVLGVDPAIAEGIKWNAPSFRTVEYFATVNLREKKGIGVILHLGARARELGPDGIVIDDPATLLQWLAKDRAMMVFADLQDFRAKQGAFGAVVSRWLVHV